MELQPGETKQVIMELVPRDFMYYDKELKSWTMESGEYEILVGASSKEILLRETLEITTEEKQKKKKEPLSEWYERPVGYPGKESFEKLMGRKIPIYRVAVEGEYTLNSTFEELQNNWIVNGCFGKWTLF